MTLVLTITNVDRLENNQPTWFRLDRYGAVIGRSPTADWSLPDPHHYISSVHCEIDYRDDAYVLVDKSTNGTFVNGDQQRLAAPHCICSGDVIVIGHYAIKAELGGAGVGADAAAPAAKEAPAWGGWQPQQAAAGVDAGSWDRAPARPEISGQGALSQAWAPPPVSSAPSASPPVASAWATPAPPATPASGWSSPVSAAPAAPSAVDVWGQLAASNVVDWARGGFGERARETPDQLGLGSGGASLRPDPLGLGPSGARLRADPLGLDPPAQPPPQLPSSSQPSTPAWGPPAAASAPAAATPPAPSWSPERGAAPAAPAASPSPDPAPSWSPSGATPPPAASQPSIQAVDAELAAFLVGAGLQPSDLKVSGAQAMTAAGSGLRRVIAGLVVMLEARARAKSQLGAQGTSLEFDGNNPLKFARAPEKAIAQLLNPPERGFMSADRAIDDAFRDLQAHQMATLTAMQGALASTLARFSPQAIRERAERQGFLAKLLPGGREATLWQAYEREFEGVAKGSDEAFMDVFAKEFRLAYEKASADMKRKT
jgi:type VI secretion system FHA domain protein